MTQEEIIRLINRKIEEALETSERDYGQVPEKRQPYGLRRG